MDIPITIFREGDPESIYFNPDVEWLITPKRRASALEVTALTVSKNSGRG